MKPPDEANAAQPWTRKHHTRGRNGCLTCKQRHLRCDGVQPICGPCARLGKACEFPSLDPPLRERRAATLPGQQTPWAVCLDNKPRPHPSAAVTLAIDTNPVDPFDCLPLRMPFKSKELLHYFFQQNHELLYKKPKNHDVLPSVVRSPDALRDTLLVADLHYLWNARDFKKYQSTGLFHKGEAMQTVNKQLKNPASMSLGTVVKHIATLSFLETAVGNVTTAQAHLEGLLAILEYHNPLQDVPNIPTLFDDEISHRYLILASDFIESMRKKIQQLKDLEGGPDGPNPDLSDSVPPVFQWLPRIDVASVSTYLKVMAMSPFMLTPRPLATKFRTIDGKPFINFLRSLNIVVSAADSEQPGSNSEHANKMESTERLITGLRVTSISTHFKSLTEEVHYPTPRGNTTSWCGIAIASGMYLRNVLRVWKSERGFFRRWMIILARDLAQSRWKNDGGKSNLWFWEHFVAAYSLAANRSHGHVGDLQATSRYFNHAIQTWSLENRILTWEDAHDQLRDIAWPTRHDESLAKSVWENAMSFESEGE